MATILSLKRRIKTARNVSKTTKAMQMISASKLKKAQDAALSSRPYVDKIHNLSKNLTARIDKDELHDYMIKPDVDGKLIIFVSPDKGLSGGLVSNLLKEIISTPKNEKISYITIGKKATSALVSMNKNIVASFDFGTTLPSFETVYPLIKLIEEYFLGKKVSEVQILSTRFVSVFSQISSLRQILPVELDEEENSKNDVTLFEPNLSELLPSLMEHSLEMVIYQNLLESFASEQAARMLAMKNATDNALDIIDSLQLEYNKTRQTKITNEILDIGGADGGFNYA